MTCGHEGMLSLRLIAPKISSRPSSRGSHSSRPEGSSRHPRALRAQDNSQYFKGYHWFVITSSSDLNTVRSSYGVSDSIVLEAPKAHRGVVDLEVALFPSMIAKGLRLPFCRPVQNVLDYLALASSQLHLNTWIILMSCYIVWR